MPDYTIKFDTVQGHEVDEGIGAGRILRTGIILVNSLPAGFTPSSSKVTKALQDAGMPLKGSSYPTAGFEDYFLKRVIIRSITATILSLQLIYEWRGLMTVRDTSSLSMVTTQIHPDGFKPIYVTWKEDPANPNSRTIKRVANLQSPLPMRHLVIQKTVTDQSDVLQVFGSVNSDTWQGLPEGYWLFSGIDGETLDEGITYTYTATFSTKQKEDWSQLEFIKDDRGRSIPIPAADVEALRAKPYEYSVDTSVNGLTKVGMYPLTDFLSVFGL